jgi:hypothetical protein
LTHNQSLSSFECWSPIQAEADAKAYFSTRLKTPRRQRGQPHNPPFGHLYLFVAHKAGLGGVPLLFINVRHTS